MIDSHCHLADETFDEDLFEVIERAREAGVDRMICIADSMEEGEKCRRLANENAQVFFTIGTHPHVATGFMPERDPGKMREIAADPRCRAIGEIGLDYHYMKSPKDVQQRVFEAQLKLAAELDIPAVVHCREAVGDLWTIVNHVKPKGMVIHCCTEKWSDVERFVKAGYHLSFTGIATYPKSDDIRETIRQCPLEQLMIETDSPYLAPVPHRGGRNEPAYVKEVLACIAQVKNIDLAEADARTTQNTVQFFRLPS